MVMTNDYLNYIRNKIANEYTVGKFGTDNTDPTVLDTGLYSEIGDSSSTLTVDISQDFIARLEHTLDVAAATDQVLGEYGIYYDDGSGDTLVSRFIQSGLTKTEEDEIVTEVLISIGRLN